MLPASCAAVLRWRSIGSISASFFKRRPQPPVKPVLTGIGPKTRSCRRCVARRSWRIYRWRRFTSFVFPNCCHTGPRTGSPGNSATRILVGSIDPERSSPERWEGFRLDHPAHIAASLPRDVLRRLSAGADQGEVERRLLSESLSRRGLEPEPPVTGAHHGEVFSSRLVGCRVVDETAFRDFARVRTWSPEVHPHGPPEVHGPFDETVHVYVSFSLAVISSERGRFLRVPTQLRPSYMVRTREGVTESLRPFGTF